MILPHHRKWPKLHETAFIAPSADVIGEVEIGEQSSVWFQVVIRGDVNWVKIGARTNIQDGSVLHVTRVTNPLIIGDDVTVGHNVTLHGCKIGNKILVGMSATVLDDAEIGDECIIGAGALVTKGAKVPPRSLVLGSPAKVVRELKPEEIDFLSVSANNYVKDASEYQMYVRGPKKLGQNLSDLETFDFDEEGSGR
ncbi:MAG: gamma carbonic anhydrase family protein [Bdellovibrionales bacterium RIFOXYD1_FULL_44_7]|nr:MAG: gamma carbonic anhydrase family protein [Bdellovibrionales bacterium RIFOXYD1_FULL_44_7]